MHLSFNNNHQLTDAMERGNIFEQILEETDPLTDDEDEELLALATCNSPENSIRRPSAKLPPSYHANAVDGSGVIRKCVILQVRKYGHLFFCSCQRQLAVGCCLKLPSAHIFNRENDCSLQETKLKRGA